MPRSFSVEINPQILNWAIERSGFSLESLVYCIRERFKVKYFTDNYLKNIISNKERAQYTDVVKIDTFLKRGIPFYFLNKVPDEKIFPQFRSKYGKHILPDIEFQLRKYFEKRDEILYLLNEQNIILKRKMPILNTNIKPSDAAEEIRKVLQFNIIDYPNSNSRDIFEVLRNKIENNDIFVFRDGLPLTLRGCIFLDSKYPPLILINSSDDKNAEIFSLLHELGHYLLNEEDVDIDKVNANIPSLIENWCNSFAYFFMINEDIEKKEGFFTLNKEQLISEERLNQLSTNYKVSKLAFMFRFYLLNFITKKEYLDYLESHRYKRISRESSGGDYYITLKSRLSRRYISLVSNNYSDGKISLSETFNYLGVRNTDAMNQIFGVIHNG